MVRNDNREVKGESLALGLTGNGGGGSAVGCCCYTAPVMEFGMVVTMASSSDGIEVARWSLTALTMNTDGEKWHGLVVTRSGEVVVSWRNSDVVEGTQCRRGGCGIKEGELAGVEVGTARIWLRQERRGGRDLAAMVRQSGSSRSPRQGLGGEQGGWSRATVVGEEEGGAAGFVVRPWQ
jgi:hypothetical protein